MARKTYTLELNQSMRLMHHVGDRRACAGDARNWARAQTAHIPRVFAHIPRRSRGRSARVILSENENNVAHVPRTFRAHSAHIPSSRPDAAPGCRRLCTPGVPPPQPRNPATPQPQTRNPAPGVPRPVPPPPAPAPASALDAAPSPPGQVRPQRPGTCKTTRRPQTGAETRPTPPRAKLKPISAAIRWQTLG
jgi:hypothetical protein